MNIGEKVAYLKGLAEGLEVSSVASKNGKILNGILDVLEDIAASIETLEEESESLEDYIDEIDEDLSLLEKSFIKTCGKMTCKKNKNKNADEEYNKSLFSDFDADDDDYDEFDEDEDEEYEDGALLDGLVEIKCPRCGRHIFIETDDLLDSESINCVECGNDIKIINEMDDGDGCSCEHCAH